MFNENRGRRILDAAIDANILVHDSYARPCALTPHLVLQLKHQRPNIDTILVPKNIRLDDMVGCMWTPWEDFGYYGMDICFLDDYSYLLKYFDDRGGSLVGGDEVLIIAIRRAMLDDYKTTEEDVMIGSC